ncbi:SRPBCC family protein [Planomonospora parontospora]|uniref:SRPBCC family protein n=2 Tax=Planomonospora parontospora TaxID=58119 RepID=UPI0016715D26|nr:SRPBCC family protein [Planomonospora parontospora]
MTMSPKAVPVTVRAVSPADPQTSFRIGSTVDLTRIFTGFGPLPAVVSVANQSGTWDHVGVARNPVLSDGTSAYEQITAYDQPTGFAYEVSGFTNVLNRFVVGARGSWVFTPAPGGGTAIEWTYAFRPRPFRGLAVRFFLAPLWRPYMRRALAAAVREIVTAREPLFGRPR